MRSIRLTPAWLMGIAGWVGLMAASYAWLLSYSFAGNEPGVAPQRIPRELGISSPFSRSQLFLALHPHCPCSRATLGELAKILTRCPEAGDVTILLYKPADEPDAWAEGALLETCRRLPCQVRIDPDGRWAALLGNLTSGAVALYDTRGLLRYQGGITVARGHEGDNAGEEAVIEILRGSSAAHRGMPVFGCSITTTNEKDW